MANRALSTVVDSALFAFLWETCSPLLWLRLHGRQAPKTLACRCVEYSRVFYGCSGGSVSSKDTWKTSGYWFSSATCPQVILSPFANIFLCAIGSILASSEVLRCTVVFKKISRRATVNKALLTPILDFLMYGDLLTLLQLCSDPSYFHRMDSVGR
jgi:hypothetical protein